MELTELKPGVIFRYQNQIYEVLEAKHLHLARGSALLQTKIKNLKDGSVISRTFRPGDEDQIEEIELEKEKVKFLYSHRGKYFFCKLDDPSKRFFLEEEKIENEKDYLKPEMIVEAVKLEGEVLNILLPIKVELEVIEAPPSFEGDTVDRKTKIVTLETGKKIKVPIFIEKGDVVEVNTKTGEYKRRVKKGER